VTPRDHARDDGAADLGCKVHIKVRAMAGAWSRAAAKASCPGARALARAAIHLLARGRDHRPSFMRKDSVW